MSDMDIGKTTPSCSPSVSRGPASTVLGEQFSFDPEEERQVYDHPVVEEVLQDTKSYYDDRSGEPIAVPDDTFLATETFDFSYLERFEHVEWKWVNEPYAYVTVVYDARRGEHRYLIVEPSLDEFEYYVRDDLIELLRNNLMYRDFEENDREEAFRREALALIDEQAATVDADTPIRVRTSMPDGSDTDSAVGPIERARFDLTVLDSDRSGAPPTDDGSAEINPYGPESVILRDSRMETNCNDNTEGGINAYSCGEVFIDLENRGTEAADITEMRLNFFNLNEQFEGSTGGKPTPRSLPESLVITDPGQAYSTGQILQRTGAYESVGYLDDVNGGETETYRIQFYRSGNVYRIYEGDYFVLTAVYQNGDTATYFVGPER